MRVHTHTKRAHPHHVVYLPGTAKTLLRQRVPASTNELVAMPIELATLSDSANWWGMEGGQRGAVEGGDWRGAEGT